MKAFLDTSSLVKLYHNEKDSDYVLGALSKDVQSIILAEIAILEFRSAFWKKARHNELSEKAVQEVIDCFEDDHAKFEWIRIDPFIIDSASKLLMRYGSDGLRTLDSLQLASAVKLKRESCIFLTSDSLLLKFFKNEGLNTL
ncbi:type II toxin-antitoxin system VapC family toxin [Desulfobacterium sp. N47]|uniref:PIN domain-containing protein n=1 Tax=uncultured Desulfobacterium sp. TaxID=201089 RepID=E1YM88_9BACT|nr:hypothetical protein N47_E47330 [uncultured Desulfobacterium sp.]